MKAHTTRVAKLIEFVEFAQQNQILLNEVVCDVLVEMHQTAFEVEDFQSPNYSEYKAEKSEIIRSALLVAIEQMATDNMSKARQSKREDDLRNKIEYSLISGEKRARENGHSSLNRLIEKSGGPFHPGK